MLILTNVKHAFTKKKPVPNPTILKFLVFLGYISLALSKFVTLGNRQHKRSHFVNQCYSTDLYCLIQKLRKIQGLSMHFSVSAMLSKKPAKLTRFCANFLQFST